MAYGQIAPSCEPLMALICQWLNKISDSDSALKKEF